MHAGGPDPQRRPGRPPRQRQDLAARGAAVRGRGASTAWAPSSTARRSRTPRPTSRRARCRSRAALASFEWQDRKINLLDTPGEPELRRRRARRAARLRVGRLRRQRASWASRSAPTRLWERAAELDLARLVFVNMLDRERADFFRTLDVAQGRLRPARRRDRDPDRRRARGPRRHRPRRHEGLRVRRRRPRTTAREIPIPDEHAAPGRGVPREAHGRGRRELRRAHGALPRGRGDLPRGDRHRAQGRARTTAASVPVTCGVATRNLGTNRLLDAIVEDLPVAGEARRPRARRRSRSSPTRTPSCSPTSSRRAPTRSPAASTCFRVYQGVMRHDAHVLNTRAHAKERIGQLLIFEGKETRHADEFGPGDIGAVAKLKETRAGDWLAARDEPIAHAGDQAARAGHGVRHRGRRPRATRRRSSPRCAASRRRTRRSTCTATRRPASRSSPASRRSTSR